MDANSERIYTVLTPNETLIHEVREGSVLKAITFQGKGVEVTDSYHTMEELYKHRYHLYLALVKVLDSYVTPLSSNLLCWKSKLHDDGTMFEDSFILGMTIERPSFIEGGDSEDFYITYHLPMKYWNMVNCITLPKAPPYDGHTSQDVLERLLRI